MNIGFGLDLAGLSNHRGTVLASIRAEGELADVNIFQSSPFGTKMSGSFEDRLKRESLALSDLLRIGKVSVDVPIALQGLPDVEAKEAWQLTLRPVDKKLKALPPLASLLGACVARFKANIWANWESGSLKPIPRRALSKYLGKILRR